MNAEKLMLLAREELRRPPDCTKTRLLARAVLVLLARVRHETDCAALHPTQIGDESGVETVYPPCSCGLDEALEEILP